MKTCSMRRRHSPSLTSQSPKHTRNDNTKQETPPSSPPPIATDTATDGTLGGGQIHDFPTAKRRAAQALTTGLWRARGAMEGLLHVRFLDWAGGGGVSVSKGAVDDHVPTSRPLHTLTRNKTKQNQLALQFRYGGATAPVPQRVCALLRASLAEAERQVCVWV